MSRYEDALWSGVAFMDSHDGDVALHEWRTFATSLKIQEKYPGVNGIGVIFKVERDELQGFLEDRDADGWALNVYPEHSFEPLLPITYIVPEDINLQAIGLDVAHEENRRTALLASQDIGAAQITGPIFLVQDSGHTSGFLFYTPFYYGSEPKTLEERRERFAGVVYAPFVVKNLVAGLLAQDLRHVDFSLRDGDQLIYNEHDDEDLEHNAQLMFSEVVELEMYGRTWAVDIRTNTEFQKQNVNHQPVFILIGGLIIEALVIAMLIMLARANAKARLYAERLTVELRAKTDRLEKANEEIEQFVYIASHDLKTPVRGIGFLTDVLEEDLMGQADNLHDLPEVKKQLAMIRGRVSRMNDLTNGIMNFFRVSSDGTWYGERVRVADIISDCVSDFGLGRHQITVETDIEEVVWDPINFRRTLENLIGNAFKYHPDSASAQVKVWIETCDDRLYVSVSDNGRGIAAEFQKKIFEVFQTLRRPGDPESTGIGLSIVKKAVERHGGTIRLESEVGSGATFHFDWPIAPATNTIIEDFAA
jgi:signal transduction histidine kinase